MDVKSIVPELLAIIESDQEELISISKTIWENPEIGFEERIASKLLADKLRKAGFAVEAPYAGMETAFRAEFTNGSGGGTFAIAAEYDALPGIGHACAHNLIGVASISAGIAAKSYMEKYNIPGTVIVLGTPAEEGGGGKVLMLRNDPDCFKNVDAVMMAHDCGTRTSRDQGSTAIRRYDVIFTGKAAHAAGSPEKGLNALDAQILLMNAVGLFRQQMNREALIHGVIFEGGDAPNIIPDHTRSRFSLRGMRDELVDELYDRFEKMVEGAALMTGCQYELKEFSVGYRARRPNQLLNNLYLDAARELGMNPDYSFKPGRGSSDFGNFSHAIPGAQPAFGINPGETVIPGHSEELKACANSDFGYDQALKAGASLAACGIRIITDQKFREEVRAEFEKR